MVLTSKRHWLDLLKDFDNKISYHPKKGNVVLDALSSKGTYFVGQQMISKWSMLSSLQSLLWDSTEHGAYIAYLQLQSTFIERIRDA